MKANIVCMQSQRPVTIVQRQALKARTVRVRSSEDKSSDALSSSNPSTTPTPSESPSPATPSTSGRKQPVVGGSSGGARKLGGESTDAIATFFTRRFGIVGGLAWFGFLAVGSLGEQVKTRIEVANEEKNAKELTTLKEVTLKSGVKYTDLKIGGGSYPDKGLLAVINFRLKVKETGEVVEDTFARGKPIVLLFGGRPFTAGMTAGFEEALKTMRAGGRRIVVVPPELGFGEQGGAIQATRHAGDKAGVIPPNATLEYECVLERVSIPPS